MAKTDEVWLVEMWIEGRWHSCPHGGLTAADARDERDRYAEDNPHDKFRIAKYRRVTR